MLRVHTLLVSALVIAAVIVLGRVIWGSPLVTRVRENFANAPKPINTMTECPPGSTMYMHEGKAYCCGGQVAIDADSVKDTCRPANLNPGSPAPLFCTLGGAEDGIPNCVETRAGIMQAMGEQMCPTEMPNLVLPRGAPPRCCKGLPNADSTACENAAEGSCAISQDKNWITEPGSCQWIKFHDENHGCPTNYTEVQAAGHGALEGAVVFGCLNQSENTFCYSKALVGTLQGMGYDTTGLNVCTPSGAN